MPRKCSICSHPDRKEIDAALVNRASLRNIAKQFGSSAAALHRHKRDHLPAVLAKAQEAAEVVRGDDLLAQVAELQRKALSILSTAERAGNLSAANGAIREARSCIELQAKMLATVLALEQREEPRQMTTAEIESERERLRLELHRRGEPCMPEVREIVVELPYNGDPES